MLKYLLINLVLLVSLGLFAGDPAPGISCQSLKACGQSEDSTRQSCSPGESCVALSECDEPKCISETKACIKECLKSTCKMMESFPAQVSCD
ncbi:MAG: hypothetical protein VX642_11580 [Bdellovibrionota bacterium]|nr:hypothetical protein [Bdellovibrionota bacterium]